MKHIFEIEKFDGGLNTKISPLQGELNESPDLQNVTFDDVGAVGTRNGYSQVNSDAASGALDMLHSYRSNSGAVLLAAYSTVYEVDGTALTALGESTDVFTAGVRIHAENCQNYCFMGNGTNEYKYNGTDFTLWGVPSGTTDIASSIVSANSTLAGSAGVVDYAYRFSYINSTNVESEASPVKTFTITNTCSPVNIAFDTVPTSYGVNNVSVYRDDYLLETVTVATTTVTDNHETLTTARDTTIDGSRPPNINIFLYHDGYMFGAVEDTTDLYYSAINSPEDWDTDNYFRVGDGDGYTIRSLAIFNNGLVIGKEDGNGNGKVFVLYMPDSTPANWSLDELDFAYGSISPKAIARFSNYLMLLNKYGVFDLTQTTMGVMNNTALSYNIEPDVNTFVAAHLNKSVAVMYKNKIWISLPYSSGTTNNRIYQYDFVRGKKNVGIGGWSRFTGIAMKDLCIHDGTLYGSNYGGYIHQLDTGRNDNSAAIDSYFKTMYIYGKDKHRENTKVWRFALVTLETSGNWNVTVEWNSDFHVDVMGSTTVNVDNAGSLWGTFVWGVDRWGATYYQKVYKVPINIVSKAIQLKFSTNTADQYFKLYKISLHYSLRGVR